MNNRETNYNASIYNLAGLRIFLAILTAVTTILSFMIPFIGIFVLTPCAMFFASCLLWLGDFKNFGLYATVGLCVNVFTSPLLWMQLYMSDWENEQLFLNVVYLVGFTTGIVFMCALTIRNYTGHDNTHN